MGSLKTADTDNVCDLYIYFNACSFSSDIGPYVIPDVVLFLHNVLKVSWKC